MRHYQRLINIAYVSMGLAVLILGHTLFVNMWKKDISNNPYVYTQGVILDKHETAGLLGSTNKHLEIELDNNYGTIIQNVDTKQYLLSKEKDIVQVVLNVKRDSPQDQVVKTIVDKKQLESFIEKQAEYNRVVKPLKNI